MHRRGQKSYMSGAGVVMNDYDRDIANLLRGEGEHISSVKSLSGLEISCPGMATAAERCCGGKVHPALFLDICAPFVFDSGAQFDQFINFGNHSSSCLEEDE